MQSFRFQSSFQITGWKSVHMQVCQAMKMILLTKKRHKIILFSQKPIYSLICLISLRGPNLMTMASKECHPSNSWEIQQPSVKLIHFNKKMFITLKVNLQTDILKSSKPSSHIVNSPLISESPKLHTLTEVEPNLFLTGEDGRLYFDGNALQFNI